MRKFRASLIIAALFSGTAAYAETPGWTISESSGPVFVAKSGVTKAGLRGGALAAGDTVVTGAKGRAVLVRGTEYLIVASNSKLQIATPTANSFTQIVQQVGNVVFKIKKQMTPHFAVETPYLAAVVKGTTFSVTVTPAGTSVQVTEGLVEVATPDRSVAHLVQPGEIGMISSANPRLLTIQGKETIRLEAPVLPGTPVAAKGEASSPQPAATGTSDGLVITAAVSEGAVSLSDLSGGLVEGNSALVTATRSTETVRALIQEAATREAASPAPVEVAVTAPPVEAAPAPVEVAVTAPPVEAAPAPVEVAVAAPPVEAAPAPVEVAVTVPPVEAAPAPVEVAVTAPPIEAAPAPVEVAVTAPPVEAAPAPVEVAVAAPPVEAAPAPVEIAVAAPPVEAAPAPVEVAVTAPPVEAAPAPVEVAVAAPPVEAAPAPVEVAVVSPDVSPALPQPVVEALESGNSGSSNGNGNGNNGVGNGNGGAVDDQPGNSDSGDADQDSFFTRLIDFLKAKADEKGVSLTLPGLGK